MVSSSFYRDFDRISPVFSNRLNSRALNLHSQRRVHDSRLLCLGVQGFSRVERAPSFRGSRGVQGLGL